ncbi:MAG: chemotaxis protein CheW [Leptolyngbyaceae cyanobacterium SU_3_3]|nr:chemotaxis protein CheW [Leptolyngbyaceae cyanobacterium SU_3_3]
MEKFIAFAVSDYRLALPIATVLQVVKCPLNPNRELSKMGLIQIGQHTIRVVDLHQQLGLEKSDQVSRPFLLITQSSSKDLSAIPVGEPPSLIEFSLERMQQLPLSTHQPGVLAIASHAAIVSNEEATTTIFC